MAAEKVDGTWTCLKHNALGGGSVCPSCVIEIVRAERAELGLAIVHALEEANDKWERKYEGRAHGDREG